MAELKQAFLVPSGPSGHHLFFIVAGPSVWEGYGGLEHAITACICTVPNEVPYDTACVLQPGEHSFIQRPSYVSYRHMRVDPIAHIEKMLATNVWIGQPPCNEALLTKIVGGVCHSRLTPREFKRLFGCP